MLLRLIPQRADSPLAISVSGEVLVVNGSSFDLSPLAEGQSVSAGGLEAARVSGVVEVSLPLPYWPGSGVNPMQPVEINATDGPVAVPGHTAQQPAEITPHPIDWPPPPPTPTQRDLDEARYLKRARVQADLMSWMAADNMSRVRAGVWTVQQLTSLLDDPYVRAAQAYMATLSFELAAQAISAATTPLLTEDIKTSWVEKLQANFFLVP